MTCNNICKKYKSKLILNNPRYTDSEKRCNGCEIFIKWDGYHCPCCKQKLRTKPRMSKYKIKLLERKN